MCPGARHLSPMNRRTEMTDLSGRLLVAMPALGDARFDHSVIFLCVHSEQGAMGIIVNKPVPDLTFVNLLEQLGIPDAGGACPIHFGGPMEGSRGFVLHSPAVEAAGTMEVTAEFGMTTTPDILRAISGGQGPDHALLALGYAGWAPGQLEGEIRRNDWLVCDATPDLVFGPDNGAKWTQAIRSIGIDPLTLSAVGGRA